MYNSLMSLDFVKSQLKQGNWLHGSSWDFDWYLTLFFVEEMSFGLFPLFLGYDQAVIGDEFLEIANTETFLEKFTGFLDDRQRLDVYLQKCSSIISQAQRISQDPRDILNFNNYEKVQKELSLLLASVSVIFDYQIGEAVKSISIQEQVPEENLINYIVGGAGQNTTMFKSRRELKNIYKTYQKELVTGNFSFEKLSSKLRKILDLHAEKYGWINTGIRGNDPWTPADFLEEIKDLAQKPKKVNKTNLPKSLTRASRNQLITYLAINIFDNKAADLQVYLDFHFQKYLKRELGTRYDERQIETLEFSEIKALIEKKDVSYPDHSYRIAWPENGKTRTHYFKTLKDFDDFKKLIKSKTHTNHEIKGVVACRGEAKGLVKVVNSTKDLADFQEGQILVAQMTQPSYVVAMKKAAAIVTDVGGITSHAAIISREFQIPCVVATQDATKKLKNGDYVLVDAIKGIVHKL